MTVALDLPPNVEQAYLSAARPRGVSLEVVVREVVIAAQPTATQELSPEEWVRSFKAWAHSHDADNLPLLSDEAISRDSIYD